MAMFRWFFSFSICLASIGNAENVFLDFESAWQRVLQCSPELAIAEQEINVLQGEKRQVSLLPNPVATVEGDNLGVRKHDVDAEPPEVTFAVTQLFELGGKRYARCAVTSSLESVAFYCAQIARKELQLALTVAFIEVSSAQERMRLAQERECVALETLQAFRCLVEGGKISPIQERKAHVALVETQICLREASSSFEQARKRLAALWGSSCIDFDGVSFSLYECVAPPACCTIENQVYCTPEYAKAKAEIISASQNIQLQRVNSIPDVALTVGYRRFIDSSEHGWLVGAEFPLPLFNRNQGNIQRAYAQRSQAACRMAEIVRELKEGVTVTYERLTGAFEELTLIENGALAEMAAVFDLIQCGYQCGKYELLELLEAHNLLIDIQEKHLNLLHDYHISRAELERLTGEIL
jgi:outer membrane protein, heavy metal efflux system